MRVPLIMAATDALIQRNAEIRELKEALKLALDQSALEENWQSLVWREECQKKLDEIPRKVN